MEDWKSGSLEVSKGNFTTATVNRQLPTANRQPTFANASVEEAVNQSIF